LVLTAAFVPRGAALGFVCGLGGGIAALIALTRRRERALTVLVAIVPLIIAIAFILAEMR
jgi:hypothetical protein